MTNLPPDSPDDRFRLPPLEGVYDGSDAEEDEPAESTEPSSTNWSLTDAADAIDRLGGATLDEEDDDWESDEDDAVVAAAAAVIHAAERDDEDDAPVPVPSLLAESSPMNLGPAPVDHDDDWLPDFLRPDVEAADAATSTIVVADPDVRAEPLEAKRMNVARPSARPTVVRTVAEIPVLLIVAAVIAFAVKTFLAQAYYIPSGSMLPQLQIDDRVVVSKLAYKMHDPHRGDIVVFDDPRPGVDTTETTDRKGFAKLLRKVGEGVGIVQPSTDEFIKRVIGLPGDSVQGKDGHVFINDKELEEPYLPSGVTTSDFPEQTVEKGKLWVMGDNRSGSADSRVFGQIKISTIVGRAVVKVWPFSHISFL